MNTSMNIRKKKQNLQIVSYWKFRHVIHNLVFITKLINWFASSLRAHAEAHARAHEQAMGASPDVDQSETQSEAKLEPRRSSSPEMAN